MHARLLGEQGRALERLDDEVVGDVAREAEVDGGVDERLHDEEDVGRAGAATRRSPSRPSSRRRPRAGGRGRRAARPPGRAARRSSPASRTRPSCPCPSRAGVFGMLRTTWSWPRRPVRAVVVAPARTLRTSWPRARCGPISRPTLASIWGLMPSRMTSAPSTASTFERDGADAVFALEVLAPLRPRMARDDLLRVDQLAAEQAGDHRLGHDAGADGRDRGLWPGGTSRGV